MAAMAERIESVEASWSRKDVKLDVQQIRKEHDLRASWLDSALRRRPGNPTLWDLVGTELDRRS
jgi:hypothetical protein